MKIKLPYPGLFSLSHDRVNITSEPSAESGALDRIDVAHRDVDREKPSGFGAEPVPTASVVGRSARFGRGFVLLGIVR